MWLNFCYGVLILSDNYRFSLPAASLPRLWVVLWVDYVNAINERTGNAFWHLSVCTSNCPMLPWCLGEYYLQLPCYLYTHWPFMYESFTVHFHRDKDGGTNTLSTTAELNAKRMSLDVSEIRREKYIVDNVCIFMFKIAFTAIWRTAWYYLCTEVSCATLSIKLTKDSWTYFGGPPLLYKTMKLSRNYLHLIANLCIIR
jgi:hypothetical protein